MAYTLKRKETAEESISRLLKCSVKKALDTSGCDSFEAIHNARKEIKKMRAILRLVRHDISKKDCASREARLRKAAKYLGPARDAYINAHTFENLLRKAAAQSGAVRFPELQSYLKLECREEMRRFAREDLWSKMSRLLEKERACASQLCLKHDGWCAIGPGLQKSYRSARRARVAACEDCSAVNLHELRKRVKDLGYDVSLLEPIWPEQISALSQELDILSDLLGDHHDLQVLRHLVAKKSVEMDFEHEANQLLPILDAQQLELSAAACKLGARLLKEKPADFSNRLHGYWKRWKKKKSPQKQFGQRSGGNRIARAERIATT
jgi:CHAD domain-containing protein